jgi:xanthine dehydrogenase large subunit
VQHVRQVIPAVVVADTVHASPPCGRARSQRDPSTLPAILSIQDALAAKTITSTAVFCEPGDAATALANTLSGTLVGGQGRTWKARLPYVLPRTRLNGWCTPARSTLARCNTGRTRWGWTTTPMRVGYRHGGDFGGKTQTGHLAVWAAVASL